MPENAVSIANYFIEKSLDSGSLFTPMQLLKLVYIAHGWNLALKDGMPLVGEAVEAWKYGPVVPSVYRAFKGYGSHPVNKIAEENCQSLENSETKPLLDKILEVYGRYDGSQLSSMTHREGTPWQQTVSKYAPELPAHLPIPNRLIREYYTKLSNVNAGA